MDISHTLQLLHNRSLFTCSHAIVAFTSVPSTCGVTWLISLETYCPNHKHRNSDASTCIKALTNSLPSKRTTPLRKERILLSTITTDHEIHSYSSSPPRYCDNLRCPHPPALLGLHHNLSSRPRLPRQREDSFPHQRHHYTPHLWLKHRRRLRNLLLVHRLPVDAR